MAIGLHEEYQQMARLCSANQKWLIDYEIQVLGMTHAELSAEALAAWNLPEPIQVAVRYHGKPELDPTPVAVGQVTLSRVLNAADQHVRAMGTCVSLFENQSQEGQAPPDVLGLGERLPAILSEFEAEFTAIQAYF